MRHSSKDIEDLRELARGARPEDAAAIEAVAKNYPQPEPTQDGPSLSLKAILLIALGLYVLFTPFAIWQKLTYVTLPEPHGRAVESLFFRPADDGKMQAQTYRLMKSISSPSDDDEAVLYERSAHELSIVDHERWHLNKRIPQDLYRFVTIDATQDEIAGKLYWIVLP